MIYRLSIDPKMSSLTLYAGEDIDNLKLFAILPNASSIGWINASDMSEHFVIPL